jgi:hypothetical protein
VTIRVLRYEFNVADRVGMRMPQGAQLLDARPRGLDTVEVWALVDDAAPFVRRRLKIAGTGHPISPLELGRYVATTVSHDSPARLVWHLFDLGEEAFPAPPPVD